MSEVRLPTCWALKCTGCANFEPSADSWEIFATTILNLTGRATLKKEEAVASRRTLSAILAALILGILVTGIVWAQPAPSIAAQPAAVQPKIDSGDTAWVLTSSALVLLMTAPGLALFYGGMVRQKNALATIMQSFIIMALISVQWVLWGYSLAFGPDKWGIIGGLEWVGLRGVGLEPGPYSNTVPHQAYMLFQLMFAIITPALITGTFAERMKFSTFLVFTLLWATLVYDPLAHWVWGNGGWLKNLGALDFAGGTVVHISSGISALVAALVIGQRRGFGREPMPPHSLPFTVMGAALLWFGWFGFNAGSALSAGAVATSAFTVTNTAAASAALAWMFSEWAIRGKPTVLGAASGAVAGLVAITPASGYVEPLASIAIGAVAGFLCYNACNLKTKVGYDDSLDVVGVHGVGGTWGALATGLFATKTINVDGGDGLFYGNPGQLWNQVIAIVAAWVLGLVVTFILLKLLDATMGLRVTEEEEVEGLDVSQHSETAYSLGGSSFSER
jgi:ammonium transporter, Amt family